MARMGIGLSDAGARAFLGSLASRAQDLQPVRADFAEYMVTSVKRNFEAGGRPQGWPPSRRAQLKGGKTLVKTARLQRSILGRVSGETVLVGTNVAYAAAHQFGVSKVVTQQVRAHARRIKVKGKKGKSWVIVRAHTRRVRLNLPARPFLLVHDEDRAYLNRSLLRHLGATQGAGKRSGR
ncbi:MAG: phage virion morphogenesis protein [Desulfarculus sp.]|nr:phage virion morphogenesis protein [Desulfarculus sp.]